MSQRRITVLISGNGTNLQALIDATTSGALPNVQIIHVISNRKAAYGLQRAAAANIPSSYHNLVLYKKSATDDDSARLAYDAALAKLVLDAQPDLVVLAGFMHILSNHFLEPLSQQHVPVINLHPALPGEYDGANAIERSWKDGKQGKVRTGVMVHRVILEVDRGEPLAVEEVPLRAEESLQEFTDRMHVVEHRLIVEGTRMMLEGFERREETTNGAK